MRRILWATINTCKGLAAATVSEAAFRQELLLLLIAIPAAYFISTEVWKRVALIGIVVFTLIVELLNTAIEKLADRVTVERDSQIARVKDMGSAAVGLCLLAIFLSWSLALAERLGVID